MTEGLNITIADGKIKTGGNILKYATDDEMVQLRKILLRIGSRYKKP